MSISHGARPAIASGSRLRHQHHAIARGAGVGKMASISTRSPGADTTNFN